MISLRLIVLALLQFCFFNSFSQVNSNLNSKFTVVIDPGHGGKDPGNTGNGFIEKDIALNISLSLGKKLEVKYPDPSLDGQYRKDVSSAKMLSLMPNFKFTSFKDGIKKVYNSKLEKK